MTEPLNQLIEALRNELKEYGEMLALLDEQQEQVLARNGEMVMQSTIKIELQASVLRETRAARERTQRVVAREVQEAEDSGLFVLAQRLPAEYRPLLVALVHENNQLLGRVQHRVRQNHLLLSRSVELLHRFIQSLAPADATPLYCGTGTLMATRACQPIYEAVG